MALSAVRYNCLTADILLGKHVLVGTGGAGGVHLLRAILGNAAPNVATHAVLGDFAQIANGHGYVTDGESVQNVATPSGGVVTLVGQDITWTTPDGAMGAFRYMGIFNVTQASKPLMFYYDLGASLSLTGVNDYWKADFGASLITL